jgi:2-amino-4-hydroxy-6-hydroxymethyldihydropteridine diphosphokinase
MSKNLPVEAFIAFGSNLGNRYQYISNALKALEFERDDQKLKLTETSFLYESEPKYFLDQGKFLNGVVKVCLIYHNIFTH